MQPAAVVMNLSYTGLGIARSLARRGVRVIGLTSTPRAYGNATRCAKVTHAPDSREAPGELLSFLLRLRQELPSSAVIFPTRDDDVVFLDRRRAELGAYTLAIPPAHAVRAALDKQETYSWTQRANVPSPRCWTVQSRAGLESILHELPFPCVIKPAEAYHWRKPDVWQAVGGRKAIVASSPQRLFSEYDTVARLEPRALLQEFVSGADEQLWIAACYMDRNGRLAAAYSARKLAQVPAGFGTGCILQAVDRPDLIEAARRVLTAMDYRGLAEVEFKYDEASRGHKLIEVNPRPWDQHRLGYAIGTDLIYAAYCDYAGLPLPAAAPRSRGVDKWVAEDVVLTTACRMLWNRDPHFRGFVRALSGRRIYGIWSASDPLPFFSYLSLTFVPQLLGGLTRAARRSFRRAPAPPAIREERRV